MNNWYDEIGKGYSSLRVPDSRISAQIHHALFSDLKPDKDTLIANIGAGTGAYEPDGCEIIAIEPSELMLREYKGSGLRIQGAAENIPLDTNAVDASMGILTLHHWRDWKQGLAEIIRISRSNITLLTHTPDLDDFWLLDYFPQIKEIDQRIFPKIDDISSEAEIRRWTLKSIPINIPGDCSDGFLGAYWKRPDAYFNDKVRRSISTFNLLDPLEVQEILDNLRADLQSGAWNRRYGDIKYLDALDVGYRLLQIVPPTLYGASD